jgi:hypothetical protein
MMLEEMSTAIMIHGEGGIFTGSQLIVFGSNLQNYKEGSTD